MLHVDQEKCLRDGICANVCPTGAIAIEQDGYPVIGPRADHCVLCGHCVAVCPLGVLSHEGMAPSECPPLPASWRLNPEQAERFLKGRRSVRNFTDEPVDRESLERLVDIARYAPSGINQQPVHWVVVQTPAEVRRLVGLTVEWMQQGVDSGSPMAEVLGFAGLVRAWQKRRDLICRGAPNLIIAHGAKDNPMAPGACMIGLTYVDVAAPALGLGSCWAGYFHMAAAASPSLREALLVPEDHEVFGALMLGHPRYAFRRIPQRNPARITWR